ncbi:MAG TPA: hypothetical protein VEC36_09740 [Patescibacteria group bacterium]|nr:hypothetical protein [Patescibacteria group bacterium]
MKHLSDIELLEYLDGENSSAAGHVDNCARCRSSLAVFKKLRETAVESELERTAAQFTSRVMAEVLTSEEQVVKMQIPHYWRIGILLAAACVIILVVFHFPAAAPDISNMKLDIMQRTLSFEFAPSKTGQIVQNLNRFFKNPVVIMFSVAAIVMSILAGFERVIVQWIKRF